VNDLYAKRREHLLKTMGPGVVIIPSTPIAIRNNDVEHEYRQDSDFFYLTGFDEPESVLVLSNQHEHKMVLFVRPRDVTREIWDGPRAGVEGAVRDFGANAAFTVGELADKLPDYLGNVQRAFYRVGRDRSFDDRFFHALDRVRSRARTGISTPSEIVDPGVYISEMRLRKSSEELKTMARASEITREAHLRAMHVAKPGAYEYEVEAEIIRIFRFHGSERPAYGSIVGSGPNATILHYRKNDRKMQDGDLLLIDAGAEYGYYASDVTRTFPVNGKFTKEQRAIYELVLAAQEASINAVRPGITIDDVHQASVNVLTQGLLDLGLLKGTFNEAVEKGTYKSFYMHRTSHWLGMDVHDVGPYFEGGKARPLQPGFVLTVEPGLYIGKDADVDPKWRGIGVRIEDDIAVTDTGFANLTSEIPRSVAEIEQILAERN
jgi:Xaa-Pro aminopeptidase